MKRYRIDLNAAEVQAVFHALDYFIDEDFRYYGESENELSDLQALAQTVRSELEASVANKSSFRDLAGLLRPKEW